MSEKAETFWAVLCWILLWVVVAIMANGCSPVGTANIPNSLPAAGSSLEKTIAHVESAERLTTATVPHADPVGKELLNQVSAEHKDALAAAADTKTDLVYANQERAKLVTMIVEQGKQLVKVMSGWGYRLQVCVHSIIVKLEWIIGTAIFLHFALGTAGLFIAGPWGELLARLGVWVNPFTWFQKFRDFLWFQGIAPAAKVVAKAAA